MVINRPGSRHSQPGHSKLSRIDFAWRHRPTIEFKISSDFGLALLQVQLN